jgi:hypothetical protein
MNGPEFIAHLSQSAGALSTLVAHILDPSVSDWSDAKTSSGPLFEPHEKEKFKALLDPYVPSIRSFFKGESSMHQYGGAEEIIHKVKNKLMENMQYMGKYGVVQYGGNPLDRFAFLKEQEEMANEGEDVLVPFEPPFYVPLRLISVSVLLLFDLIRMMMSLFGFNNAAKMLSVVLSLIEVMRGNWKIALTSFAGYFGTDFLWIGQLAKVFLVVFQTIPTAMYSQLRTDGMQLGQTIIFGIVLSIFQTIAPSEVRKIFIETIKQININNKLLTQFFNTEPRKTKYHFDPANPEYSMYFKQYSWGDLTEFQNFIIKAQCTTEMIAFHKQLEQTLQQSKEAHQGASSSISPADISESILKMTGLLPFTEPNCPTPTVPLVQNVINLVIHPNTAEGGQLLTSFQQFKQSQIGNLLTSKVQQASSSITSALSSGLQKGKELAGTVSNQIKSASSAVTDHAKTLSNLIRSSNSDQFKSILASTSPSDLEKYIKELDDTIGVAERTKRLGELFSEIDKMKEDLIEKFNKNVKLPPNSKGCFQCGKYLIWLNK